MRLLFWALLFWATVPGIGALAGPPSQLNSRGPPLWGGTGEGVSHYAGIDHAEPVGWVNMNSSNGVCCIWEGGPEGSIEKSTCLRASFPGVHVIEHDWLSVCVCFTQIKTMLVAE